MPKEKPIIPSGIPNPVGPAVFPGIRNPTRIGGNVPVDKYPLVCHPARPYQKVDTSITTQDFKRLQEIVKPIGLEEPDPYQERLNRLREESKLLQMGWSDNKKDLVKKLAEKFLEKDPKEIDKKEIEVREAIKKNIPKRHQGPPKLLTGNNEREIEVRSGFIMSEILAQRKEHEEIAKAYKARCQQREMEEHYKREQLEAELTAKARQRVENHTRYIASVNHFQAQQAQKKKNDVRAAKLASDSERRNFVNELYDDAKAKGYQETVKEKQIRDLRGADLRNWIDMRAKSRKAEDENDQQFLNFADNLSEDHHRQKMAQKTDRYERVLRNGQKQQHAYNWLKENVHDQIIANDKEDEIIKVVNDREDTKWYAEQKALEDRKSKMAKSLHEFKAADEAIKTNRLRNTVNEKKMEAKVVNEKFSEHLVNSNEKEQKRLDGAKNIGKFWDKQCQELQQIRQKERQVNADYQDAVKRQEDRDEDIMERQTENLISIQQSLGRETFPMRKCKKQLAFGTGPHLVASDGNYGNRINAKPFDISLYHPEDSRNRLSINWNPGELQSEYLTDPKILGHRKNPDWEKTGQLERP